jgi:hypothetical protein
VDPRTSTLAILGASEVPVDPIPKPAIRDPESTDTDSTSLVNQPSGQSVIVGVRFNPRFEPGARSTVGRRLRRRPSRKQHSSMRKAPLLFGLILLVPLGLCSCASPTASVQGYVVRYGPVPSTAGTTTTLPLSGSSSTVQVTSAGKIVAVQKVRARGQFHFALPPGTYEIGVVQDITCHARVALRSGTITHSNVVCVEP